MNNVKSLHKFKKHFQGVFDAEILRFLKEEIDRTADAAARSALAERDSQATSRGESVDAVRLNPLWYKVWMNVDGSLLQFLRPFTWVYFPPQVRRIRERLHEVPWHQDLGFVRSMPPERQHKKIVTCFVPLDADPYNRVTLQFTHEEPEYLEHSRSNNGFAAGLVHNFTDTFHYETKRGDALVFGDLVPHRTYQPEGTVWDRTSFEFRLIDPSDALGNKDYFDLDRKCFVQVEGTSNIIVP
jgi:hypothetical protein